VNLYNMLSTIEAAKGISKFAAQCIREDGDGNATDEGTMFAPAALSHLAVPGVTEKVAATKMQAILRGRKARQQVNAMNDANSEVRPGDSPEQMLEDQEVADQAATLLPNDRKSESIDAPPLPTDLRRPSTKMSAFGESVDDDFGEEAPSKDQRKSSKGTSKESEDSDDSSGGAEDEEWPPKAPTSRFKNQMQFSTEFKVQAGAERSRRRRRELGAEQSNEKVAEERETKNKEDRSLMIVSDSHRKGIEDNCLSWVNQYFKMDIFTENEFEAAFPFVLLSMMDVIYPKKVRWHQVDWNASYLHALRHNHSLLEALWLEVNMDKLPQFRSMRVEHYVNNTVREKLEFTKQTKRWFDQRVQHSASYDPIVRRTQIEKMVRATGRFMKFPHWMQYDKEAVAANRGKKPTAESPKKANAENATSYESMPEFKRLIWFLGSAEHQTM